MSAAIEFHDEDGEVHGPFSLGSSSEWVRFATIAEQKGPALLQLCRDGEVKDTCALARELQDFDDPIAEDLRQLVGIGHVQEIGRIVE